MLTTGRAVVAGRIERAVQELADRENLGISVRAVRLGRIAPPVPVLGILQEEKGPLVYPCRCSQILIRRK